MGAKQRTFVGGGGEPSQKLAHTPSLWVAHCTLGLFKSLPRSATSIIMLLNVSTVGINTINRLLSHFVFREAVFCYEVRT